MLANGGQSNRCVIWPVSKIYKEAISIRILCPQELLTAAIKCDCLQVYFVEWFLVFILVSLWYLRHKKHRRLYRFMTNRIFFSTRRIIGMPNETEQFTLLITRTQNKIPFCKALYYESQSVIIFHKYLMRRFELILSELNNSTIREYNEPSSNTQIYNKKHTKEIDKILSMAHRQRQIKKLTRRRIQLPSSTWNV